MRICRKCAKQTSDESKICRDCGAILEDAPDNSVAETEIEWKPAAPAASSAPAEHEEAGAATAAQAIIDQVVAGSEEPAAPDAEAPAWKCPQCGEDVPGTFDVCWKCLTTKDGQKPGQEDAEFLQRIAEPSEDGSDNEPTDMYDEALGIRREHAKPSAQGGCIRCGSDKMMRGVRIRDQAEISDGWLKVVVFCFDDPVYGELQADICGDCGHVELRVRNPKALYEHYRKSEE